MSQGTSQLLNPGREVEVTDADICKKTPDIDEIVLATLPSLPGCNSVTFTVAEIPTTCALPVPTIWTDTEAYAGNAAPPGANVLSNTPTVLMSYKDWSYVDCYSDSAPGIRALPNRLTTTNQTVEACLIAASAAGYKYAGLECKLSSPGKF